MALNETWLLSDILQLYESFGNYNGTFKLRNRLGGGGDLMLQKTKLLMLLMNFLLLRMILKVFSYYSNFTMSTLLLVTYIGNRGVT